MSEQKSKLFLAIILSIISVLLISAVSFTFPARAAIPLNVEFAVGEKMVYDTTRTTISDVYSATYNSSTSSLQTEQTKQTNVDSRKEILEVIGFDGQRYTLNHTFTNSSQGMVNSWFLETISKVGQST